MHHKGMSICQSIYIKSKHHKNCINIFQILETPRANNLIQSQNTMFFHLQGEIVQLKALY